MKNCFNESNYFMTVFLRWPNFATTSYLLDFTFVLNNKPPANDTGVVRRTIAMDNHEVSPKRFVEVGVIPHGRFEFDRDN